MTASTALMRPILRAAHRLLPGSNPVFPIHADATAGVAAVGRGRRAEECPGVVAVVVGVIAVAEAVVAALGEHVARPLVGGGDRGAEGDLGIDRGVERAVEEAVHAAGVLGPGGDHPGGRDAGGALPRAR